MKAGRLILLVLLACALSAAAALTYKRWPGLKPAVKREQSNNSNQQLFSSLPPFSTKEPNRYQATRIITTDDNEAGAATPRETRVLIARDGDRRREDYDSDADFRTSYLETPAGTFILLPTRKVYADLNSAAADLVLPTQQYDERNDAAFSAERLLSKTPGQTRYEKMGVEQRNGQLTTKYRVTSAGPTGTESATETLIWIDETLGMAIRSETSSANGSQHVKLATELREIKLQVDPKQFELPKDYKLVAYSEFLNQWRQTQSANKEPKP